MAATLIYWLQWWTVLPLPPKKHGEAIWTILEVYVKFTSTCRIQNYKYTKLLLIWDLIAFSHRGWNIIDRVHGIYVFRFCIAHNENCCSCLRLYYFHRNIGIMCIYEGITFSAVWQYIFKLLPASHPKKTPSLWLLCTTKLIIRSHRHAEYLACSS